MSATPSITVVIPTRDRWELARRAVRSAQDQRGVETGVVVVDDASREPGPDDWPAGVTVIRRSRRGGDAGSRNTGLEAAEAEWVAFLDDDDVWSPRKLELQIAAATQGAADFAYCDAVVVDEGLRAMWVDAAHGAETLLPELIRRDGIPSGSNLLCRTRTARNLGGFDPDLTHVNDWDFAIRLAATGTRGARVAEPLVGYVQHPGNRSALDVAALEADVERLRAKHRGLYEEVGTAIDDANILRWVASCHLRMEHRALAAGRYLRAWRRSRDLRDLARAVSCARGPRTPRLRGMPEPEWLQVLRTAADPVAAGR